MEKWINLSAYSSCCINNEIYFFANECNALMRLDSYTDKIDIVSSMPEELIYERNLVSQLIAYQDSIILIPMNAKNIWIYEICSNSWESILLECNEIKYKFMRAVMHKEDLYILPSKYFSIVKFNLISKKVTYLKNVLQGIYKSNSTIFRSDVVVLKDVIYAACCVKDCIMKLDMKTDTYELISLGLGISGYSGIAWDGKKFWITPRKNINRVILWDGKNKCQEIYLPQTNGNFIRGISINDEISYIKKEKVTICIDINDTNNIRISRDVYIFMDTDEVYKSLTYSGIYKEIKNDSSYEIKLRILNIKFKEYFEGYEKCLNQVDVMEETEVFDLIEYIKCIKEI